MQQQNAYINSIYLIIFRVFNVMESFRNNEHKVLKSDKIFLKNVILLIQFLKLFAFSYTRRRIKLKIPKTH